MASPSPQEEMGNVLKSLGSPVFNVLTFFLPKESDVLFLKITLDFGLGDGHQLSVHRMHATGRLGRLCIRIQEREKDGSVEKSVNQSLGVRKPIMDSGDSW